MFFSPTFLSLPSNILSIGACLQTVHDMASQNCPVFSEPHAGTLSSIGGISQGQLHLLSWMTGTAQSQYFIFYFPQPQRRPDVLWEAILGILIQSNSANVQKGMYLERTFNICSLSKLGLFRKFYSSFGRKTTVVEVLIETQ